MDALLYFALWAAALCLMMRLGCGAHVMGRGQRRQPGGRNGGRDAAPEVRWVPPEKDIDPVCGRTLATETARPSVYEGNVYYFCSRECREAFEAAPDLYAGEPGAGARRSERPHAHNRIRA
ncbi:MAG: YHS domain-containing protein [Kiloniellaceae bacterium]